jgi:hypothetical protein
MGERLIVTNGDEAVARMREAGLEAEFLPWRDVLHDGPVPSGVSWEALSDIRARHLAEVTGLGFDRIRRGFADRDALMRDQDRFSRIELWFEHDLFDQLQLIQVVAILCSLDRTHEVTLVQARDFLGPMSAAAIKALDGTARPLTAEQFAAATTAWDAFTAPTLERLAAVATADPSPLPCLPAALRRLLAELPAVGSGLGLTQERALSALAEKPHTVAALFKMTQDQEEARFLGDKWFFARLDGLAFCPTPLINGLPARARDCADGPGQPNYRAFATATIALTDAGRAALAGSFDHAAENGIDRWLGGTHVTRDNRWRRDSARGVVPQPH